LVPLGIDQLPVTRPPSTQAVEDRWTRAVDRHPIEHIDRNLPNLGWRLRVVGDGKRVKNRGSVLM
jgi:hypothetical protein